MEWISALISPLLMIIGGVISWVLKDKSERLKLQEEKLKKYRKIFIFNYLSLT